MLKGSDSRVNINHNAENRSQGSNKAEQSTSHEKRVGSSSTSTGWDWTTGVNPLRLGAHWSFNISLHFLPISPIELQSEKSFSVLLTELHFFFLLRAHSGMRIWAENFRWFWNFCFRGSSPASQESRYSFLTGTCLSCTNGSWSLICLFFSL